MHLHDLGFFVWGTTTTALGCVQDALFPSHQKILQTLGLILLDLGLAHRYNGRSNIITSKRNLDLNLNLT